LQRPRFQTLWMIRFLESASSRAVISRLVQEHGSAVVDFVLTAIPVFATLQFMLGFLVLHGTSFATARETIFESGQLALADRDNRGIVGFALACSGGTLGVLTPRTCWHSVLEPTF
jgi:hypothetical protein